LSVASTLNNVSKLATNAIVNAIIQISILLIELKLGKAKTQRNSLNDPEIGILTKWD